MNILQDTYEQILRSYAPVPPECGGILGSKNGVICAYHHDTSSSCLRRAVYEPDVQTLNRVLDEWAKDGLTFAGVVHSHPPLQNELSSGDCRYIRTLLESNPQTAMLYFPVMLPDVRQLVVYAVCLHQGVLVIRTDDIQILS